MGKTGQEMMYTLCTGYACPLSIPTVWWTWTLARLRSMWLLEPDLGAWIVGRTVQEDLLISGGGGLILSQMPTQMPGACGQET